MKEWTLWVKVFTMTECVMYEYVHYDWTPSYGIQLKWCRTRTYLFCSVNLLVTDLQREVKSMLLNTLTPERHISKFFHVTKDETYKYLRERFSDAPWILYKWNHELSRKIIMVVRLLAPTTDVWYSRTTSFCFRNSCTWISTQSAYRFYVIKIYVCRRTQWQSIALNTSFLYPMNIYVFRDNHQTWKNTLDFR